MKCTQCQAIIPVSIWMEKAISFGCIFLAVFIAFLCYIKREVRRHKEFYGKTDQLTEMERKDLPSSDAERRRENELDAAAFGACPGNIILRKDIDPFAKSPGFRVMVPHKKKTITPIPAEIDKVEPPLVPTNDILPGPSPYSPYKLAIHVTMDKTGRAEELLEVLKKDNYKRGTKFKVIDSILINVVEILEKMTRRLFLVVGFVPDADGNRTIVRGQEHMQESNVEELIIKMKLELTLPFEAIIVVYQFEAASEPEAKLNPTPIPIILNANEKAEAMEEIQTDVTPQITPMIQSVKPGSAQQQAALAALLAETPASRRTYKVAGVTHSAVVSALAKNKKNDEYPSERLPAPPPPASPIVKNSEKGTIQPPTSGRKGVSKLESKNKTMMTQRSGEKVKESLKGRLTLPVSGQQTSNQGNVKNKSNLKGSHEKVKSSKQVVTPNVRKKQSAGEEQKGSIERLKSPETIESPEPVKISILKESQCGNDQDKMGRVQGTAKSTQKTTGTQSAPKGNGEVPKLEGGKNREFKYQTN